MEYRIIEEIKKGWSGDKKYRIVADDGKEYLLRISPTEKSDRTKGAFSLMEIYRDRGVSMCEPIEIYEKNDSVYLIESFVDGDDAENVIPKLSYDEQYRYGVVAGENLRLIHSVPAPENAEPWTERFGRKLDRKIENYAKCELKYENGDAFIEFIRKNRRLINDRPQVWQHGDYHIGNMIVNREGKLVIIDFDRYDFGDPWEEFNRIVWCGQKAPVFAKGMIDGYFENSVPEEFFRLLALYISANALSSLPWAIPFGEEEIATMKNQAKEILSWYDGMKRIIPSWYSEYNK